MALEAVNLGVDMSTDNLKSNFKNLIEFFLKDREWEDSLGSNDSGEVVLDKEISLSDRQGKLILEASDEGEYLDIFIYLLSMQCKNEKMPEMFRLLNTINQQMMLGKFSIFEGDKRFVRWQYRLDVTGLTCSVESIDYLVSAGAEHVEYWTDPISTVALTSLGMEEALAEFESAKAKENSTGSESADEL